MKFSLSLLKRFLQTDASLETIGETLTAIGLEIESITDVSATLAPFVVAEILEATPHPDADKLRVCKVRAAQGELQIVCGAPNARAGIKVALANVGAIIPNGNFAIKASKIRGVESNGMLCSADELNLGGDSTGIIELPLTATIGDGIVEVLGLNDPVLDVNITANRGDCMGVYGIARDLAAAGLGTLKPLCVPAISAQGACPMTVTIEDTEGCPAFIGRVIRGVKNGESPEWLKRTLTAAGMRPISALVDITNYFLLAFARPLHVYDLAKLQGNIKVRNAREGETLAALNEKTYTLTPSDCVIADEKSVLGLGGIMGGSATGVTENTTDILLEVALFSRTRMALTGRGHQIDSDARARFERGVDPEFLAVADARATELILELCGGIASEPRLAGAIPSNTHRIVFDAAAVNALGGTNIPTANMQKRLHTLGFSVDGAEVISPSWRHDISIPADIAEEILRLERYDAIAPVSLPKSPLLSRPALASAQRLRAQAKRSLAARGLNEAVSFSFISEAEAEAFGGQIAALKLQNPISSELSVMRPSLLAGLLAAASRNQARGVKELNLFEIGACFAGLAPDAQPFHAAAIRMGAPTSWHPTCEASIYDAKADLAAVLEVYGIDMESCQTTREVPAWYHPGRSARISRGPKQVLGTFGELHPALLKNLGIEGRVVAFESNLDALPLPKATKSQALQVSDFQAVQRDFAFVLPATTPASELLKAVRQAEKKLLRDVSIFDVYAGKGVAEGYVSIALTVTLQADDRTLTDAEIEAASSAIILGAQKIDAALR